MKELKKERHYGLDLLRIVCMLLVVWLHLFYRNGLPGGPESGTVRFWVVTMIKCACVVSSNCYAMISGYFGISKKNRLSNMGTLWLQVVLYCVSITAAVKLIAPELAENATFLQALLPVNAQQYWYFTAYFMVFLVSPLLEYGISGMTDKQLWTLVISLGVFMTMSCFLKDAFVLNRGHSSLWLIYMYLVGGALRRVDLSKAFKRGGLLYVGMVLLTTASFCILETLGISRSGCFQEINSPFLLLASVGLFCCFAGLKVTKCKKLIALVAPLTFGVLLIHNHPLIIRQFGVWFKFLRYLPVWKLVVFSFAIAAVIFTGCIVVDWFRLQLFRLLGIKTILQKLETKLPWNKQEVS